SDVAAMLKTEQPDIVCISCPPPLHFDYAMQSLQAGAHLLCEKPLVYDASKSTPELIEQANTLVATAATRGVVFGTQMQYATTLDTLLELSGHAVGASNIREFTMEMETKNLRPGREYEAIWIDMSPHPLSVLQKIAPDAIINPDSIECTLRPHETATRFELVAAADASPPQETPLKAHITVRYNPDRAVPLRQFVIDGQTIDYVGRNNAEGEFCSYLTAVDGRSIELPDFVDTLIGNFVQACQGQAPLTVTGADGAQNVAWQLQILGAAQRE
ncbi:MAG: Gfo/Idh/MocA family oxidoreductase, partial [Abitibacteriaceae bacterium]|nr:Gfo/Idh/MocA family oxidoreductase [Abditibacteriaceae bacterium]